MGVTVNPISARQAEYIEYMKDAEMQSALQAIMENGAYRAPDNHEVNVDAGIIFLGNILSSAMNEYQNMFIELPKPFHQPQFLDRIHGFIKGWELPRMTDDLKVCGWALNSEYFATVLHALRDDPSYRAIVDQLVVLPKGADTRDTETVKRICTAYLKLLFPNVRCVEDITALEFKKYCLKPAMEMRQIIHIQMGYADAKYQGSVVTSFTIKEVDK
jgi:ATP-dependent Lon protease